MALSSMGVGGLGSEGHDKGRQSDDNQIHFLNWDLGSMWARLLNTEGNNRVMLPTRRWDVGSAMSFENQLPPTGLYEDEGGWCLGGGRP